MLTYKGSIILGGILIIFLECLRFGIAIIVAYLVSYFENKDNVPLWNAYAYAASLAVGSIVIGLLHNQVSFWNFRIGWHMRTGLCALMYKKTLRLSQKSLNGITTGKIVNLGATDVLRFDFFPPFMHYCLISPLLCVCATVILWREFGTAILAGMGTFFVTLLGQILFGKVFAGFRASIAILTDSRVRWMNEVIIGIRIIKMYTWEKPFENILFEARRKEVLKILQSGMMKAGNMAIFTAQTKLVALVTISVHILTGGTLSAFKVFILLGILGALRISAGGLFLRSIVKTSETLISAKRIQEFLLSEEISSNQMINNASLTNTFIELKNFSASWSELEESNQTDLTLNDVSFQLNSGQLLAVVGPVGAGKSSLLSAILGELPALSGEATTHGKISYADQTPWIFSGTIKDNILLGEDFNEERYKKVISACCLIKDIKNMPNGDLTPVGERGVTLSGGQKARLNLARAAYQCDSDIFLLDDPLSAVDPSVARHIFGQCISGLMKDKTRVLVTHQVQLLKTADKILLLKQGKIAGCGTYEQLKASLEDFESLLKPKHDEETMQNSKVFTVSVIACSLLKMLMKMYLCVSSGIHMHKKMIRAIFRAPVRFFDTNPAGRILNRFSKDMGQVDELLPMTFLEFIHICGQILSVVVLVVSINYLAAIIVVPSVIYFIWLRRYYIRTSRDIKRLEGACRSPVFSLLSSTLQGLATVRGFGAESRFEKRFHETQDLHGASWFLFLTSSRWFGVRLDMISSAFIGTIALASVVAASVLNLDAGKVGLILTHSVSSIALFQWGARQSAEVENMMTSVERIQQYYKIQPEAPDEIPEKKPHDNWPLKGSIEFKGLSFAHYEDGPIVLKNLGFQIHPQEKIGLAGRTGAGKSSVISALFRLAEFTSGEIYIDGIGISTIGLSDLRSVISIIPQDPILFSGTLRKNFDIFNNYSDKDIWDVITQVQLYDFVISLPDQLNTKLTESGSNFSVGQRQLVCLARALLRKNKILLIDEATANVDMQTDRLIQTTIRDKFTDCTVITIAHRINTIIDSDRIIVLEAGEIVEFDDPHTLLQRKKGAFSMMVDAMGQSESEALQQKAKSAYLAKQQNRMKKE